MINKGPWTSHDHRPYNQVFVRPSHRNPGEASGTDRLTTLMTTEARKLKRFGNLNVGTYTDKEEELLDLMRERNLDNLGL